ncbi:MAG: AAA family ATPase [Hyphomicrobiaceae bacterium]|nr:MAG: AAA family ATPase [Hyphomicrobiaceae bacterium]
MLAIRPDPKLLYLEASLSGVASRLESLAAFKAEYPFLLRREPFQKLENFECDAKKLLAALKDAGFTVQCQYRHGMLKEGDRSESAEGRTGEGTPFFEDAFANMDRDVTVFYVESDERFTIRVQEEIENVKEGSGTIAQSVSIAYSTIRLSGEALDKFIAAVKTSVVTKKKDFDKKPKIYLIVKSGDGYDLHPFSIKVPQTFDLSFYEPDGEVEFATKAAQFIQTLSQEHNGAYLFGGAYGTGKTTFIKWLTQQVDRKFIFIPENMATSINDPNLQSVFLDNIGAVFVIEDAEKILADRADGNSFVSTILNMSDGMTAEVFKSAIILTFNGDKKLFDKAIFRTGRCKGEHDFALLSPKRANMVAEKLGKEARFDKPTPLCDIIGGRDNFHREKEKKGLGFGA